MSNIKTKLLSMFVLPLSLLTMQPVPLEVAHIEPQSTPKEVTPIEVIKRYSAEYGVDPNLAYSVLKCESGLNQNVKGDGGKSVSIAQWAPKTFEGEAKLKGEVLNIESMHDAAKLAIWTFSQGRGHKWTMYQAVINGGSFTFTNSYTGEVQTVYCSYKKIPE